MVCLHLASDTTVASIWRKGREGQNSQAKSTARQNSRRSQRVRATSWKGAQTVEGAWASPFLRLCQLQDTGAFPNPGKDLLQNQASLDIIYSHLFSPDLKSVINWPWTKCPVFWLNLLLIKATSLESLTRNWCPSQFWGHGKSRFNDQLERLGQTRGFRCYITLPSLFAVASAGEESCYSACWIHRTLWAANPYQVHGYWVLVSIPSLCLS